MEKLEQKALENQNVRVRENVKAGRRRVALYTVGGLAFGLFASALMGLLPGCDSRTDYNTASSYQTYNSQ
jgi:hypothetical protein